MALDGILTGSAGAEFASPGFTSKVAKELSSGVTHEGPQKQGGTSFGDMLRDSIEKTNLFQVQADTAVKELVAGRSKNIHETMLSIERADTSLKLLMQVRNKILDAYREIMRMQV